MESKDCLVLVKVRGGWDIQSGGEVVASLRSLQFGRRGWRLRVQGVPFVRAPDTFTKLGKVPYPGTVPSKERGLEVVAAFLAGEDPWGGR